MCREQRKPANVYGPIGNSKSRSSVGKQRTGGVENQFQRVIASLKQGSVPAQNIFPGDGVGNSVGFQDHLAAKNQNFVKIENGIAIMVKDDTLV